MQAADVVIEGNEIYDSESGIRVIAANSVQIVNNVFHHLTDNPEAWGTYGLQLYGGGDVSVINNTFAHLSTRGLFYIGDATTGLDSLTIQNNLFSNTSGNIRAKSSPDLAATDYNGWFNAAACIEGPHDTVGSDPCFVSSSDYRLRNISPVIDAGDNPSAPAQDSDGNPRPYGPAPDLGAFEWQGSESLWYDRCLPDPVCPTPWPEQPTYTPRPTPTCRPTATCPPNPSPTPYPTTTAYPQQPGA